MKYKQRMIAGLVLIAFLIGLYAVRDVSPIDPPPFFPRARAAIECQAFEKARQFMEVAVLWRPGDPRAHFGLGEVLLYSGDVQGAGRAFAQGFTVDLWNRNRIEVRRPDGVFFEIAYHRGVEPVCQNGPWDHTVRLRQGEPLVQDLPPRPAGGPHPTVVARDWDAVICICRVSAAGSSGGTR